MARKGPYAQCVPYYKELPILNSNISRSTHPSKTKESFSIGPFRRKMLRVHHFAPVNHFALVITDAGRLCKMLSMSDIFQNINRSILSSYLKDKVHSFKFVYN